MVTCNYVLCFILMYCTEYALFYRPHDKAGKGAIEPAIS